MSIQSVTAEIISGKFTNEELSSLIDSIKYARARLGKAAIRALRIGDNVTFKNITLWNNSFYCSIFYNTCMEDVYFEYDLETEENMVYSFYIEKM